MKLVLTEYKRGRQSRDTITETKSSVGIHIKKIEKAKGCECNDLNCVFFMLRKKWQK